MSEEVQNAKNEMPKGIFYHALKSTVIGLLCVIIPYEFIQHALGRDVHTYSFSLIFILPVLQGAVFGYPYFEKKLKWRAFFLLLLILCVDIAVAYLFMGEGYICLIMAFPLFWALISGGYFFGKALGRYNDTVSLRVVFIPLSILLVGVDTTTANPVYQNAVSDAVTIQAPPEVVWKYIAQYPENNKPYEYWLWDVGLPAPIQSVVDKAEVGGKRECKFTGGYAFKEEITEYVPEKVMTFKVTEQPSHPEIMGHFSLDKGQVYLERNADGSTTVIATSWYHLFVNPAFYFDWWTTDIIRNIHFRVLGHIKEISEKEMYESNLIGR